MAPAAPLGGGGSQGYDSEATTMGTSDAVLTTIRCSPCLSTSKNFSHCNAERSRLHTLNRGAHTQQSPLLLSVRAFDCRCFGYEPKAMHRIGFMTRLAIALRSRSASSHF